MLSVCRFVALIGGACALAPVLSGQATCGSPALLADGNCLNVTTTGNVGSFLAGCNGGNHPQAFIQFTAPSNGDCVQLNFTNPTSGGTYQFATYTSGCAAFVSGSAVCMENVVTGNPFSYSSEGATGANLLTPGQTYVLRIMSDNAATLNVCMITPSAPNANDACTGATSIGTSPVTLYNGGDCTYSGSFDNPSSIDPPPIQVCAGSLENTQWTSFTSTSTSIQIIGSNISCTGGGCGFQFGMFTGTCGSLTNIGCYGQKVCTGGQNSAGPTNPTGQVTWSGISAAGFTATVSGLTAGQTVYLAMDGNADADCQYTIRGVNVIALPVELVSFEAEQVPFGVRLSWLTASEAMSDYFSVEKSFDGESYHSIGRVESAGHSTLPVSYRFEDASPYFESAYYRLRQVDENGHYAFSPVLFIRSSDAQKATLVRRLSLLGSEVDEHFSGLCIEIYSDGSSRKVFRP